MPDPVPTPAAPEPNGVPAVPAQTVPAPGVPAGFVPQEVADQAEARRRATQSALDQEKANAAKLSERLANVEQMMSRFDPAAVADEFTARFNQQQAIAAAAVAAKTEFPLARADVFNGSYQTPEELVQAAKSSHDAETEYRASVRSEVEQGVFSSLKETHGIDLTPAPQIPPAEGEGGGAPALTQKALAEMPMSEFLALDKAVLDAVPVV